MFFWAVFDQTASTWISLAKACMTLSIDLYFFQYTFDPDQVQFFNALFIVTMLPFVQIVWNRLNSRGINVSPTAKMTAGFFITAACMAVLTFSAYLAGPAELHRDSAKDITEWVVADANKVTVWWQIFAYLLLTVAEILISVTGLELAYTAAPKAMSGFITGCWLASVGLGDLVINALSTRLFIHMQPVVYFSLLTVMMAVVSVAFVFVARRFNRKTAEEAIQQPVPAFSET
jgi:POT family proton-dependent oligopeptide transporter